MKTPSSMRRVTRSQQASLISQKKVQEAEEKPLPSLSRSRGEKQDHPVLLDITNDSPIVGLAMGSLKKPSSSACKGNAWSRRRTPGSGEALLRGQVKILLQKVEEETEVVKHSAEQPAPFQTLLGHLRSPAGLLAPTPANTPQITGLSGNKEGSMPLISSAKKDVDSELQLAAEIPKDVEESLDLRECLINRALFDSPEESEISDSSSNNLSALTYQGSGISSCPERSTDDDCSSTWSMQANAGSQKVDEEDGVEDFRDDGDGYYEGEEEEERDSLDALCEGLRMMSVHEKRGLPEFVGKHTRFIYNSDDEIEGEEEVRVGTVSPCVLRLRGLPVPEGKHLRFQEEEDE